MEIKLNLVPPLRKEEIKKSYLLRMIVKWQVEVLLIFILFLAILWHISYVLKVEAISNLKQIEMARQSFSYKDMQDYKEKIKNANVQIADIKKIQKGQLYWSELMGKLNEMIFSGIEIDSLSTKDYEIFLTGVADSRDNLANFKEKLTQESCFKEVDFPLANLMNKENLAFQMQFTIKKECIETIK